MNGRAAGWIPSVLIQDNDGGSQMGRDDCRNDRDGELVIINPNNSTVTSVADSAGVAASDPTVGPTVDHGTAGCVVTTWTHGRSC
jgi:hypothetical protein